MIEHCECHTLAQIKSNADLISQPKLFLACRGSEDAQDPPCLSASVYTVDTRGMIVQIVEPSCVFWEKHEDLQCYVVDAEDETFAPYEDEYNDTPDMTLADVLVKELSRLSGIPFVGYIL